MNSVIILGAGIIGITSAYELRRKGFSVTVVDAGKSPSLGTSFANGAQLSYSKTGPLSSPNTSLHLPFYLFSSTSPLHIRTADPEFIKWGFKFLWECLPHNYNRNNQELIDLSLKSRLALHRILQEQELEFSYTRLGKMYLYRNPNDLKAAEKFVREQNKHGFEMRMLSASEAVALEPALLHVEEDIVGAAYCPIDECGDARKFSEELTKACELNGVKFVWNARVEDFVVNNGKIKAVKANNELIEAEKFVSCLGIETNSLLKKLGISLPIYPMKGYSITVPAKKFAPNISITDESRKVVYSKLGNELRIAGVAEFTGYDLSLNRPRLDKILEDAKEFFPDAADYTRIGEWAGLRPMTPSCVPIIKKSGKYENLYFNTGHGMLGWTLACGSAEKLTSLVS